MTSRQKFIEEVETVIGTLSEESQAYFERFKQFKDREVKKKKFTDNGKLILGWIKDNYEDFDNMMKNRDISDGVGLSGKTVTGSIRKLITDGYVEKCESSSPVMYAITENGKIVDLNSEE